MTPMYDTLADLLITRFQVDAGEIRPDVTFEDLDMDSLFLVELLVVIQSDLGIKVSEDAVSPRDTLERAAEVVDEQVAASTQRS